jgi:mannosyltransferase OCH1-like enzyme
MKAQFVMKPLKFLVSRVIKIAANFTKLLCCIFHFAFPKIRFTIPAKSAPLIKTGNRSTITRILWQTNFTNRVTLPVYINYLFNRMMSPTFEYRFMITEDRDAFIKENCSLEIYKAYSKLQIGAAQADFWRLLVLQKYGGVYMDIDANLVWPLGLSIKPDCHEFYIKIKDGKISNYFIVSKPGNPHLEEIIKAVLNNINENTIKNIFNLTGPGVFNKVLESTPVNTLYYRYTCSQGNFTNEFFQYIDKPQGKWTKEQAKVDIVRK